jgi:hypothetical protein
VRLSSIATAQPGVSIWDRPVRLTGERKQVSVEGPIVAIEDANVERDLRPLARRYLGPHIGDEYVEKTRSKHADNILVRMRPERWLTVDFAKE